MPFFVFYCIFGLQPVGNLLWVVADLCVRGFLIGATSCHTTLNGEGLYRYSKSRRKIPRAHLFGGGALLNEATKAGQILDENYRVAADMWSITSFKELGRDAVETDRWNIQHSDEEPRRVYLSVCLASEKGIFVVATDCLKSLPNSQSRWFPRGLFSRGTEGFGRSNSRKSLCGLVRSGCTLHRPRGAARCHLDRTGAAGHRRSENRSRQVESSKFLKKGTP